MDPLQTRKHAARARLREILAATPEAERAARSSDAVERLCAQPEYERAGFILLYLSTPGEVQTDGLVHRALADGKRVAAPRVVETAANVDSAVAARGNGGSAQGPSATGYALVAVEIRSLDDDVRPGYRGIREPVGDLIVFPQEVDLVIVPGLAFDRDGYRLGRGGGFYDRYLAAPAVHALRCGLAFESQFFAEVPRGLHDQYVHMLVTDAIVRRFTR